FGDILTDLGAMVQGGIGLAASANINVERKAPSMVEGVHGSAPDIAGRGWASPYATMLSLAMGLAHCGHMRAAQAIEDAVVAEIQAQPIISGPDLPGGTQGVGERIAERVRNGESRELPGSLLDALALSRTSWHSSHQQLHASSSHSGVKSRATWISLFETPAGTIGQTMESRLTTKSITTGRSLISIAWEMTESISSSCSQRSPTQP